MGYMNAKLTYSTYWQLLLWNIDQNKIFEYLMNTGLRRKYLAINNWVTSEHIYLTYKEHRAHTLIWPVTTFTRVTIQMSTRTNTFLSQLNIPTRVTLTRCNVYLCYIDRYQSYICCIDTWPILHLLYWPLPIVYLLNSNIVTNARDMYSKTCLFRNRLLRTLDNVKCFY